METFGPWKMVNENVPFKNLHSLPFFNSPQTLSKTHTHENGHQSSWFYGGENKEELKYMK